MPQLIDLDQLDELTEQFIRSMQWHDETTTYERFLVSGNIRGFSSFLAREARTKPVFPSDVRKEKRVRQSQTHTKAA